MQSANQMVGNYVNTLLDLKIDVIKQEISEKRIRFFTKAFPKDYIRDDITKNILLMYFCEWAIVYHATELFREFMAFVQEEDIIFTNAQIKFITGDIVVALMNFHAVFPNVFPDAHGIWKKMED